MYPGGARAGSRPTHPCVTLSRTPVSSRSEVTLVDPFGELREIWRWIRAPADPEGRAFDTRFGTETRWFDWSGNYEPCSPIVVTQALAALPVAIESLALVDLGCGKGRALILAAPLPFREVVGVELRPALADRARRNLEQAAGVEPACARCRVTVGDARTAPLPDPPLVVFLYHPFAVTVLVEVLRRLPASSWIVYLNPHGDEEVRAAGWRGVVEGGEGHQRWVVYAPRSEG